MSELLTQSPFDVATERRLVVIADSLPPDFGAVGQYTLQRAEAFAARGHVVDLFGLTSGKGSVESSRHGEGSLTVTRIPARAVPRGSLPARLAWTLATDLRLVARAFGKLRAADGVLFTGSPPFLVHVLAPLKFLFRGRLVYRITDFHPECTIAALERPSLGLRLFQKLTNFWRRRVDAFEVLGRDQWRRLREQGIDERRIALVRDGSPIGFAPGLTARPRPRELENRLVLLYSGNFGVAHEVDTIARGYALHHKQGSGRVWLWLNATGANATILADSLSAQGAPFLRSEPVALAELPGLMLSADANLIALRDAFVGYVMPSKVYACLASRKPLIFVGNADSDVDLLARAEPDISYSRVSCGDAAGFATALESLADRLSSAAKIATS
jgi:hypothetical protein